MPDHSMQFVMGGMDSIATAAAAGALSAALQLVGPDHLCTLMSLCSTESDWAAMQIGGAWGLAHCVGTVLIFVILQVVRMKTAIDMDLWEHYGDYCIGFSLVLCSLYFIRQESEFIVQEADGSLGVRGCECHGTTQKIDSPETIPETSFQRPRKKKSQKLFLSASFSKNCGDENCNDIECGTHGAASGTRPLFPKAPAETQPLLQPKIEPRSTPRFYTWIGGTVLGLIQGICCPMSLVSVNFIAYVHTPFAVAVFLFSYVVVSILGAAIFSCLCSRLLVDGFGKITSPRVVYRGSCAFTFAFGVLWVAATRLHVADSSDINNFVLVGTQASKSLESGHS